MNEFRTLGEVIREMHTPEWRARRMENEQSYRRGYHQAYNQALDDVFDMLYAQVSLEDAYALSALQANLIGVWRTEDVDKFITPPPFDQKQLQATLALRRKVGKA